MFFDAEIEGTFIYRYFTLDDTKPIIESNYSSNFDDKSQKFGHLNCRPLEYYFEAIKIDVDISGYYMLSSDSDLDTYGYLYEHEFDFYSSVESSLSWDDDYCENRQFSISTYLHYNSTYVLIVTISPNELYINMQGPFSVIAKGPSEINMKRIGM